MPAGVSVHGNVLVVSFAAAGVAKVVIGRTPTRPHTRFFADRTTTVFEPIGPAHDISPLARRNKENSATSCSIEDNPSMKNVDYKQNTPPGA